MDFKNLIQPKNTAYREVNIPDQTSNIMKLFPNQNRSDSVENSDSKIESIKKTTFVSAKNSMVLPKLLKETTLLKFGIQKLTKIAIDKEKREKSELFKLKEREYESQFTSDTSPIRTVDGKEISKDESLISKLFKSDFLSSLLPILLKGGLLAGIVGAVGTYFSDPEFKKSVNGTVEKFFSGIFGEDWKEGLLAPLTAAAAGLAAVLGTVKLAFSAFESVITAGAKLIGKALGVSLPDFNKPSVPDTDSKNRIPKSSPEKPDSRPTPENKQRIPSNSGSTSDKSKIKNLSDFAKKAAKNGWKDRIFAKLKKRLGFMVAAKIFAAFTGLFLPVAGVAITAISLAMLGSDLYVLYDEIFGPGGIEEELEKEDAAVSKTSNVDSKDLNVNKSSIEQIQTSDKVNTATASIASKAPSLQSKGSGGNKISRSDAKNYLMQNGGYTEAQASGIVANLEKESGLQSDIWSKVPGEKSYGLAQWNAKAGRLQQLEAFAAQKGTDKSDPYTQLDFLMHELGTNKGYGDQELRMTQNATDAAMVFQRKFERPKVIDISRAILAENIHNSAQSIEPVASQNNVGKELNTSSVMAKEESQPVNIVDASTVNNVQNGNKTPNIQMPQSQVADQDLMGLLMKGMWG